MATKWFHVAVVLMALLALALVAMLVSSSPPLPSSSSPPVDLGTPSPASGRDAGGAPVERIAVDARGAFHGMLYCRGDSVATLCDAALVEIASCQEVGWTKTSKGREMVFLSYLMDSGFAPLPQALSASRSHEVKLGRWTMPVPEEDLIVVSVKVDGRSWRIESQAVIPAGAKTGEFFVSSPDVCTLDVVQGEVGAVASGVTVLAVPEIAQGVPIRMAWRANSRDDQRTSSNDHVPLPPESAVVVGANLTSPISFDRTDYARTLWVGKEGYAWEVVSLPPTVGRRSVQLQKKVNLRIVMDGTPRQDGVLSLDVSRGGRVLGYWQSLGGRKVLSLDGIGAGPCRIRIRRQQDCGHPIVLDEQVTIPCVATYEHRLALGDCEVIKFGRVTVGLYDPQHLVDARTEVLLGSVDKMLTTPVGNERRRILGRGGVQPGADVPVIEFERVPVGAYSVVIPTLGMSAYVSVEEGREAVASLDLASLVDVRVLPSPGLMVPEDSVLEWSYLGSDGVTGANAPALRQRPVGVESQAQWDAGGWRFRTPPGLLACRARPRLGVSYFASGIVSVGSVSTTVEIGNGQRGLGRVHMVIEGCPLGSDGELIRCVDRLVALAGAGVVPAFLTRAMSWNGSSVPTSVVRFAVPIGTQLMPFDLQHGEDGVVWEVVDGSIVVGEDPVTINGVWRGAPK